MAASPRSVVPRQKPRIVEVKSFWSRADDADIAILVENREGIAMFQTSEPPLDERSLDFDIVLGQLNLHVHGAFRSSREPNLSVKKSLSSRLLTGPRYRAGLCLRDELVNRRTNSPRHIFLPGFWHRFGCGGRRNEARRRVSTGQ